ncbi:MAG: serine/threonine-protein kinase [Pirellulales bacterium]
MALKEIQFDKSGSADNRNRFVREAEITGGLEHPGIVPVYGLGTYPDGRPFYAMRFIRGSSLKDAIDRYHKPDDTGKASDPGEKNLQLRRLLQRFIDVCEAIDYAHSRGVLHRDLKPGNIMLGKHGETLVVDWGLAKSLGETPSAGGSTSRPAVAPTIDNNAAEFAENPLQLRSTLGAGDPTMDGSALGTPNFMSPEQAQGRIDLLGPASDVFGLGATLYALLTGRPPYAEKNVLASLDKARRGDYLPPRAILATVPRALDAICRSAMEFDPKRRYATAKALADDVERYLADEEVAAAPDTLWEKAGRTIRRHRGAVLAGGAALLLLTIGSIAGTLVVQAAKNKETAALEQETAAKNEALAAIARETAAKQAALAARADAERARDDALRAEATANDKSRETTAVLAFVEDQILAAMRRKAWKGAWAATSN